MVKFGRRLVSERHEEWAEYYIDYKVRPGKKDAWNKLKLGGMTRPSGGAPFRRIRVLTTASHRPHRSTRPTRARRA